MLYNDDGDGDGDDDAAAVAFTYWFVFLATRFPYIPSTLVIRLRGHS
jgi:hypothetical protein